MNTQSSKGQLNNHFPLEQNEAWDESKIRAMEEEMELLREQVESLKREQQGGYELINECIQELEYTNKELELMNEEISNLIHSKTLPIEQAQEWAKSIIEKKTSIPESLSELLSAIYSCPINLNKGDEMDNSIVSSEVEQFKIQSREARTKSEQIIACSIKMTAHSREIRMRSRELQAYSLEFRNQLGREKISGTTFKILNLSDAIAN